MAKSEKVTLEGFNMKLKKKEAIQKAKISSKNNRYFAKGVGSDGTVVCCALGKEKAEAVIAAGLAVKDGKW